MSSICRFASDLWAAAWRLPPFTFHIHTIHTIQVNPSLSSWLTTTASIRPYCHASLATVIAVKFLSIIQLTGLAWLGASCKNTRCQLSFFIFLHSSPAFSSFALKSLLSFQLKRCNCVTLQVNAMVTGKKWASFLKKKEKIKEIM